MERVRGRKGEVRIVDLKRRKREKRECCSRTNEIVNQILQGWSGFKLFSRSVLSPAFLRPLKKSFSSFRFFPYHSTIYIYIHFTTRNSSSDISRSSTSLSLIKNNVTSLWSRSNFLTRWECASSQMPNELFLLTNFFFFSDFVLNFY